MLDFACLWGQPTGSIIKLTYEMISPDSLARSPSLDFQKGLALDFWYG